MRSYRFALILGAALSAAVPACPQTRLDLQNQSRKVDFTGADVTRPVKAGTSLPATCSTADLFFRVDAPAGQNLYACVAPNSWALLTGGSGGGSLPSQVGNANRSLFTDGTSAAWRALLGGATGGLQVTYTPTQAAVDVLPEVVPLLAYDNAWTGRQVFTPSAVQSISAVGNSIAANRTAIQVQPASALTLTSTPTIADGIDGQVLILTNVSTSFSLTLRDESSLAGSNLILGASTLAIGPRQSVHFIFNATLGLWSKL